MHTPIPEAEFCKILDAVPICTADVLFFNQDKTQTLLFRRVNKPLKGVYFSVGGRILKGETMEEAAIRQAFREVGVDVPKEELVFGGVQDEIQHDSQFEGIAYHAVDIFFGYILKQNQNIKLDFQHDDHKWFSVNDETLHPFLQAKINNLIKRL